MDDEKDDTKNNQAEKPNIPSNLYNVIINSDFGKIQRIQQLFDSQDMTLLQNNSNFTGWDNVYENISVAFGKILQSTFNDISDQIQNGVQKQIDTLKKAKIETVDLKNKLDQMNVGNAINIQTLQTQIDKWENIKISSNQLLNSRAAQYNWNNVQQLNLKGGSGGGGGEKTYTVNGIIVEASHPVLYFKPKNGAYYHMAYMFNGDITTAHGASNPANYDSYAFRTSFWLTYEPNEPNQRLTFRFPKPIKLSYMIVYSNIGSMTNSGKPWAPNNMYSIDLFYNGEWRAFCEMIDTINDALGVARTHQIRKNVERVRFNLKGPGYVVMKEIDFFVIK